MQTYPGVAVILYLTTEDSPFSPQMRARTGLGVITRSLLNSGVFSTARRSPPSLSSAPEESQLKFEKCYFKLITKSWVFVMFEAVGTAPTLVLILSLQDLKHHSTQLIHRLQ